MKILYHIGLYTQFLGKVFKKPERWKVYFKLLIDELIKLGINSIGIVVIISVFIGAVITLQTAYNIEISIVPLYLVGLTTRDSMILEFSSTIVGLVLAGKAGANIASEIGMMRVQEQIDALEVMGINSASYLVLPKIVAAVFVFPFLALMSMILGVGGGYVATLLTHAIPPTEYLYGIHYYFIPFYITYSLTKMLFFGFFVATIPAYHGYFVKGGAIEVGAASTRAVVFSSILILIVNAILTQLMLA
ncbi:MAG: ABC transporter permease [Bacteroidota bacterium]|nr:ABC transporter permease [Bacteroidota bacterium]